VTMSCPTIRPPISAADFLGTEAHLESVSAAHLYTMPDPHLRMTLSNRDEQLTGLNP
jgi:hypothetical protein